MSILCENVTLCVSNRHFPSKPKNSHGHNFIKCVKIITEVQKKSHSKGFEDLIHNSNMLLQSIYILTLNSLNIVNAC